MLGLFLAGIGEAPAHTVSSCQGPQTHLALHWHPSDDPQGLGAGSGPGTAIFVITHTHRFKLRDYVVKVYDVDGVEFLRAELHHDSRRRRRDRRWSDLFILDLDDDLSLPLKLVLTDFAAQQQCAFTVAAGPSQGR